MPTSPAMSLVDALRVLHDARTDQVVVPTMSAAREWMKLGTHPLDFIYAPSAMGHAPGLGMGLALARPDKQVIVCNGDGCMLMNLGALVTATAAAPANFVLIVCDNGVYEVTGMQPTAATPAARRSSQRVDYVAIARASGFSNVHEFSDLNAWRDSLASILASPGPTFVRLCVEPMPGGIVPKSPASAPERARKFATDLAASSP